MKKKPARKGRFFHALNAPRALCRTPRKETPGKVSGISPCRTPRKRVVWQDPGVLFPCVGASAPLFCAEKIAGAGRVLPWYSRRNVRTGLLVFRPGMGEVAAQRAGGTRPFLRRNAASLHAAAPAAAVRGTDCKIFQKTAKRSEKKLTPRGDCAKL